MFSYIHVRFKNCSCHQIGLPPILTMASCSKRNCTKYCCVKSSSFFILRTKSEIVCPANSQKACRGRARQVHEQVLQHDIVSPHFKYVKQQFGKNSFESFRQRIRYIALYLIPSQLYSEPRERIVLYFKSRTFNIIKLSRRRRSLVP